MTCIKKENLVVLEGGEVSAYEWGFWKQGWHQLGFDRIMIADEAVARFDKHVLKYRWYKKREMV